MAGNTDLDLSVERGEPVALRQLERPAGSSALNRTATSPASPGPESTAKERVETIYAQEQATHH